MIVLLSATKLVDVVHITTINQLVSQQDDIGCNHLVVLANQKSGFIQLQQLYFDARQVCMLVEETCSIDF